MLRNPEVRSTELGSSLGGNMTNAIESDDAIAREVIAAEEARCQAILVSDRAALDLILGDDLTNTHSTGLSEDKITNLNRSAASDSTTYTRANLKVRVYGDTAVMTGDMDIHFPDAPDGTPGRLMPSVALQVWVKRDDRWQLVAIQTAPRPE
jgi:hypothetical protein